jgi:uncharacterized membrane protein
LIEDIIVAVLGVILGLAVFVAICRQAGAKVDAQRDSDLGLAKGGK